MKISRDDFKALIRECLVEILSDGPQERRPVQRPAGGRATEAVQRKVPRTPARSAQRSQPHAANQRSDALRETIKRESGGDPIMAGILADTAAKTLPMMIEGEMVGHGANLGGGDSAARLVAAHAPEQIFGTDTTDKWAQLAFAQSKPGGRAKMTSQLDT